MKRDAYLNFFRLLPIIVFISVIVSYGKFTILIIIAQILPHFCFGVMLGCWHTRHKHKNKTDDLLSRLLCIISAKREGLATAQTKSAPLNAFPLESSA